MPFIGGCDDLFTMKGLAVAVFLLAVIYMVYITYFVQESCCGKAQVEGCQATNCSKNMYLCGRCDCGTVCGSRCQCGGKCSGKCNCGCSKVCAGGICVDRPHVEGIQSQPDPRDVANPTTLSKLAAGL